MKASARTVLFGLVLLLPLVSCGQSDSSGDAAEAADSPAEALSPADLGEAILSTYKEAIADMVALTDGFPPSDAIFAEAGTLKEEYVQKFHALGKQREAMSEADRATADSKLRIGLNSFYSDPSFKAYMEAANHYMKEHRELYQIIADFNIITQYASFELLKQQAPAEAKRLGIE